MTTSPAIIIADESALHMLMHRDFPALEESRSPLNPLRNCARSTSELLDFNLDNPLYGSPPIALLVCERSERRFSKQITCRSADKSLPERAFFTLRDGLFAATPELVFLRMARFASAIQLAEIGTNLCGRYFIDLRSERIKPRTQYIATPQSLSTFVESAKPSFYGRKTALMATRWICGNSGSPLETKMMLQFCLPLAHGGFNLPLSNMNFDISAGRIAQLAEQSYYSVDLADPLRKVGLEYDGEEYHRDVAHDNRRRNELKALGWNIFPIDKQVLYSPERTINTGILLARVMKIRLRRAATWEKKYLQLRQELNLPT